MNPVSKLSAQLRGLICVKFWLRTYSLIIEAVRLMPSIWAVAHPQLRGTPQASLRPSGGGRGARVPVAGSTLGSGKGGTPRASGLQVMPALSPYS